jgi:hypothetical protein
MDDIPEGMLTVIYQYKPMFTDHIGCQTFESSPTTQLASTSIEEAQALWQPGKGPEIAHDRYP